MKKSRSKKKVISPKSHPKTSIKHEIVVHVDTTPAVPTTTDLSEPMRDGKKLTIPKTWMSERQLTFMLQRTPREQVYRRKGRGGQMFDYVTGSYITRALNFAFAWNWDFEVVEHGKEQDHVWVLGKLTVHGTKQGETITKTQFGRSDVKQLKTGGNVDYGNDLKAAATDALKKCASLLGFASDIYGKADYKAESGQEPIPAPSPRLEAPTRPQGHAEGQKIDEKPEFEDHVCQWPHKPYCGIDITKQEAVLSKRLYGLELCRQHQADSKPVQGV